MSTTNMFWFVFGLMLGGRRVSAGAGLFGLVMFLVLAIIIGIFVLMWWAAGGLALLTMGGIVSYQTQGGADPSRWIARIDRRHGMVWYFLPTLWLMRLGWMGVCLAAFMAWGAKR